MSTLSLNKSEVMVNFFIFSLIFAFLSPSLCAENTVKNLTGSAKNATVGRLSTPHKERGTELNVLKELSRQEESDSSGFVNPVPDNSPLLDGAKQIFLIAPETGRVLLNKDGDQIIVPSSMTKIATLMYLFDQLDKGQVTLDDTFMVSVNAWRKEGSRMFLEPNSSVKVLDLIRGIVVQSGNDATTTVAEGVAGDERQFASQVTEMLARLGLKSTNFTNASGLPDKNHYSTARDLALMATHLIRLYPRYYHFFSEKSYTYNNIRQQNRNPLFNQPDLFVDGIKTGQTEAGGFGIVASAVKDGFRLILVINGCSSDRQRRMVGEKVLKWAFREYKTYALFEAGHVLGHADVWLGAEKQVPLVVPDDVRLTLSFNERSKLKARMEYETPIEAPIKEGMKVGTLILEIPGGYRWTYPIVAGKSVAEVGFFGRALSALYYIILGSS